VLWLVAAASHVLQLLRTSKRAKLRPAKYYARVDLSLAAAALAATAARRKGHFSVRILLLIEADQTAVSL
jgi:hypothetical protein